MQWENEIILYIISVMETKISHKSLACSQSENTYDDALIFTRELYFAFGFTKNILRKRQIIFERSSMIDGANTIKVQQGTLRLLNVLKTNRWPRTEHIQMKVQINTLKFNKNTNPVFLLWYLLGVWLQMLHLNLKKWAAAKQRPIESCNYTIKIHWGKFFSDEILITIYNGVHLKSTKSIFMRFNCNWRDLAVPMPPICTLSIVLHLHKHCK